MGSARRTQSRWRRREDGASLVEFALLAPLLFALVFGMLTGGLALSTKNSMENAVREGGRLGATLPESDTWAASVQQRVVQLASGDLNASDICVKLIRKSDSNTEVMRKESPCPASLASAEPSGAAVPAGQCAVKVWARTNRELNVIFFGRQLTLEADSINRYERSGTPATCD
jgi:Flp pilus assembly protein TadG